jgi:hypothetical protein
MTAPITAPCRYCGEREWLSLHPHHVDDHFAHQPDGSLVLDDQGQPKLHEVAHVECDICGSIAPIHVWNGEPVPARMRAALVAYYEGEGSKPLAVAA